MPRAGTTFSLSWKIFSPEFWRHAMQPHSIVSREEWIEARKAHMVREKEFTRARDRLAEERRALPWVLVDKDYVFDGPNGKVRLAGLCVGRPQLIVQHFMFAPDWDA